MESNLRALCAARTTNDQPAHASDLSTTDSLETLDLDSLLHPNSGERLGPTSKQPSKESPHSDITQAPLVKKKRDRPTETGMALGRHLAADLGLTYPEPKRGRSSRAASTDYALNKSGAVKAVENNGNSPVDAGAFQTAIGFGIELDFRGDTSSPLSSMISLPPEESLSTYGLAPDRFINNSLIDSHLRKSGDKIEEEEFTLMLVPSNKGMPPVSSDKHGVGCACPICLADSPLSRSAYVASRQ